MSQTAVYARISLDRTDGEGVERQLADCRAYATERGWQVTEYVDNDVSAFRARKRPAWDDLLHALRAGQHQHLIAYHPDRLYRKLSDLEDLIDAIEAHGVGVHTLKAGDVDLSNASGRMMARVLAAVSRHESERIGERVSRAKQDRAARGLPAGGGRRPYGLNATRDRLVEKEAAVLREVAGRIIAGASYHSEVKRLNAAKIPNATGHQWTIGTLRRTLTSPWVAGIRTYKGNETTTATWPAILDRDTWDLLRALAASRSRGPRRSEQFLLSGLLGCGLCGGPLYANRRGNRYDYRCPPTPGDTGCGRCSISQIPADKWVVEQIDEWLTDPVFAAELEALQRWGHDVAAQSRTELDDLTARRSVLAERFAEGTLTLAEYDAARKVLAAREGALTGSTSPLPRLVVDTAVLRDVWATAGVGDRRDVLRAVAVVPIVVTPGRAPIGERINLQPITGN
jgi:site-specific DNA recombinase